eukprot:4597190-Amphidinium_carterae.2
MCDATFIDLASQQHKVHGSQICLSSIHTCQGEKMQQPLKLESHELIDVAEIKQGECLGLLVLVLLYMLLLQST